MHAGLPAPVQVRMVLLALGIGDMHETELCLYNQTLAPNSGQTDTVTPIDLKLPCTERGQWYIWCVSLVSKSRSRIFRPGSFTALSSGAHV